MIMRFEISNYNIIEILPQTQTRQWRTDNARKTEKKVLTKLFNHFSSALR